MLLKRRLLLAGVLSFSGLGGARSANLSSATPAMTASDADTLTAHRHIAYADNNVPVIWYLSGKKYGVVDGVTSLLWDIGTLKLLRGAVTASGAYHAEVLEISFPFAPNSPDILGTWYNPYTGQKIEFPIYKATPSVSIYDGVTGSKTVDTPRGLMELEMSMKAPRRVGLVTWLDVMERFVLSEQTKGKATKTTTISEFTSFSAHDSDFKKDVGYVRARCDLDIWSDWSANLGMDDLPGGMLTRAQGQKLSSLAELPQNFQAAVRQHYPHVLERGIDVLGAAER